MTCSLAFRVNIRCERTVDFIGFVDGKNGLIISHSLLPVDAILWLVSIDVVLCDVMLSGGCGCGVSKGGGPSYVVN